MRLLTALRAALSPAFVVACLALAVALSGTAYAAVKVGAKDIKRDAVRSKHIKAGAVRGPDVLDGSLTGADVGDGSLTGSDVLDGSLTAADLAPRLRMVQGYVEVVVGGTMAAGQSTASVTASCPEGTVVLGGGYATFNKDIQITASTPLDASPRDWLVSARTYSGNAVVTNSAINVRITCAAGPATRPSISD